MLLRLPEETTESFAIINNQSWVRYFHWNRGWISSSLVSLSRPLPSLICICNKPSQTRCSPLIGKQTKKHAFRLSPEPPQMCAHMRKKASMLALNEQQMTGCNLQPPPPPPVWARNKKALITTISLLTLSARIQWVFFSLRLSPEPRLLLGDGN